jgi:hypothetical protein
MSDRLTEESQLSHPESKSSMSEQSSSPTTFDLRAFGSYAPKILVFTGKSEDWEQWCSSITNALFVCQVYYTVEDYEINNLALGIKGTSKNTVWRSDYKWPSSTAERIYQVDIQKAYTLIYSGLGTEAIKAMKFKPQYDGKKDIATTVKYGDAKKLWEVLKYLYDKKTTVTTMMCWEKLLKERLQPEETVTDFSTRLKNHRDKIIDQGQEVSESLVVYRFLDGLTKEYSTVDTVLRQDNNLTLEKAIQSITNHEESIKYKSLKEPSETKEDSANYVNGRHGGKFKGRPNFNKFKSSNNKSNKGQSHAQGERKQEERPQGGQTHQSNHANKSQLKCQLCNKTGHEAIKCWNYSVQQRPAPVKSSVPRFGRVNMAQHVDTDDDQGDDHAYCTEVIDEDDQERSYVARQVDSSSDGGTIVMKLDSGSTHHHVSESSKDLLSQVKELAKPTTVLTASNERLVSKVKGDVDGIDQQGNKVVIEGVKYTPGFRVNLMSVSLWCKQCPPSVKRSMVFDKDGVVALEDNKVAFKGVERDGLYELRIDTNDRLSKSYAVREDRKYKSYKELHALFGHMGKKVIADMVKTNAVDGIDKYEIPPLNQLQEEKEPCEQCVLGKGHRNAFAKKMNRRKVNYIMGRLFADLSGPINANESKKIHQQLGSKRYASLIIDEASGFIHCKLLSNKSEAAQHMKEFSLLGENSTGRRVQYIHTDQGTEYVNQDLQQFATSRGIQLENTVAYSPQQNPAERYNRTVFNGVRTILIQTGLNHAFWPLVLEAFVYLLNHRVTGKDGKTAYEQFYNTRPSISRLRPFGVDCYVMTPDRYRTKLDPRARKCIFVGYSINHNGAWKCYDIESGKVIITRDVVFKNTYEFGIKEGIRNKQPSTDYLHVSKHETKRVSDDVEKKGREKYVVNETFDLFVPIVSQQQHHQQQVEQQQQLQQPQQQSSARRLIVNDNQEIINNKTRLALKKLGSHLQPSSKEIQDIERIQSAQQNRDNVDLPTSRYGRVSKTPVRLSATQTISNSKTDNNSSTDMYSTSVNNQEQKAPRALLAYTDDAPQTYRQAMQRPDSAEWQKASDEEMKNMVDNDVFELVSRSEAIRLGKNVLKSRWVYTVKMNKHGEIERYKGRFVACGYSQEAGVDFDETFAPVGRYKTLRIALCLVAEMDYELKQMDVVSAFLNAKLKEELFIEQPDGYADAKDDKVWKLKKAIYGIKQAPYEWNKEINSLLTTIGFKRLKTDPCLYTKISKSGKVIVLFIFVDDIVIAYHRIDKQEWMNYHAIITSRYKIKDLGDAQWVLGMNITRDRIKRTITIDQRRYIKKKLEQFKLTNVNPSRIPGDKNLRMVQEAKEAVPEEDRNPSYREIVGSVLYASIGTRPDIAHAVHEVSKFNNNPSSLHYKAATRILKYLSGTVDTHILTYKASGHTLSKFVVDGQVIFAPVLHVSVFCDADWAGDHTDRKSTSGYLVRINNNTVSWSAKKQNTISLSSAEAEYMAIASAAQEAIWTRQFLTELFHLTLDTHNLYSCTILTDNTSAAQIAKHDVSHDRTKHIDIRYHFIRDYLQDGWFDLRWVPTDDQLADIFTKVLPINRFESLVDSILNRVTP